MTDHRYLSGNALVCGDNIEVLRQLPDESVDLVYLDPPFNSNQFYVAAFGDKGLVNQQLRDIWRWTAGSQRVYDNVPAGALRDALRGIFLQAGEKSPMAAYAVFMGVRLAQLRRVLKPTGSIYLHCDWHANAYLRVLMDAVFGDGQFQNEIAWCYAPSGRAPKFGFHRKHDVILYYSKGKNPWFKHLYTEMDERTRATYSQIDKDGRVYKESPGGRSYLDEQEGRPVPSWWTDIPSFGTATNSPERTGYPTQKPLALLERIISASSKPGDLVLDPFCGCGTAADAAASLGRKYLGIDISGIAVRLMQQRLESRGTVIPEVYGLTWDELTWEEFERRALTPRDEIENGVPGWAWAEDKVAALLSAVPNTRKSGDGGVDARYYGAVDLEKNAGIIVPIQVKMHRNPSAMIGDMRELLGTQTAMRNQGVHAPMSVMVTLYPPSNALRVFAAEQGRITLATKEAGRTDYPVMQALSMEEMLRHGERPVLPPVDPRSLVGDTQTRMQA